MLELGLEAALMPELLSKVVEGRFRQFHHLSTHLADKVMVMSLFDMMITKASLAEIGFHHKAELLEELQRPVDGRDVGIRVAPPYPVEDFLGADVAVHAVDSIDYHQPLGSQPVAMLFEHLLATHGGYCINT